MNIKSTLFTRSLAMASGHLMVADVLEGYYGSIKYLQMEQHAGSLDTSSRPGVEQFVSGKEKEHLGGVSIAMGYQYGNGWRTEGEYTFKQRTEYTSGSSTFASSYNHLQTQVERPMLDVYRDYPLGYNIALFASAGLGVSKIKATVGGVTLSVNTVQPRKII